MKILSAVLSIRHGSILLSLSAVVGLCLIWLAPTWGQPELADVIERCEKSVVRIEVDGKRGASLGSGFVVNADGMMVTNVHVLAGANAATVIFPNGKTYKISGIYSVDRGRDICIAQIDAKELPVLPLAAELPRKGENVTALGSPQGLSFTATRGIISAIRPGEEMGRDTGVRGGHGNN